MALDNSGHIIATGTFSDSADFDPSPAIAELYGNGFSSIYLVKYDTTGNFIWAKAIGGPGNAESFGITVDMHDNIYVTGNFRDTADFDPSLSTANLISNGSDDAFVAKYDKNGVYKWAVGMGGTSSDFARSSAIDHAGNVFVTGAFYSSVDFDPSASSAILSALGSTDAFIAKYDSLGNYGWAGQIGGPTPEDGYGIKITPSGDIINMGKFVATTDFDPGPSTFNLTAAGPKDVYFAKYDNNGNFIWAKNIGGPGDDVGYGLDIDAISNVYISGGFKNTADFDPGTGVNSATAIGTSYRDLFLSKYDGSGNLLWYKTTGGTGEDVGYDLDVNTMGDIFLTGYFNASFDFNPGSGTDSHTSLGADDFFLTKYSNPSTAIQPDQVTDLSSFKIYPNPATNTLYCETSQNTQIYIYNSSGALVFNQQLMTGKHSIDISCIVPGFYLVRSNQQENGLVLVKQ